MITHMTRRYDAARRLAARTIRAAAYSLLTFEWLWLAVIILPPLVATDAFQSFVMPPPIEEPIVREPNPPSPLTWAFVGAVTFIVFVVTIIVLIRLPKVILSTGDKTIRSASTAAIPVLTHHRPVSKKRRQILVRRVGLGLQLSLAVLPIIVSPFLPPFEHLDRAVIVVSTLCLGATSAVLFIGGWLLDPSKKST